jgi:S1-C subfamily serine protease
MLRMTHTRGPWAPAVHEIGHAPVRIGSALGNDVVLAGAERSGVMPRHAEIRWENGAYWLVDLKTHAGTYVGPERVSARALRTGDEIRFGDGSGPALRVELVDSRSAGADEAGRVDVATAQRLVESAVVHATRGNNDKSAMIVETKVAEATRRGARLNVLLAAGVGVTIVALVIAAFTVYRSRSAAAVLAAEAGLGERPPVPALAGTVPTKVLTGREIYEQNRGALYVYAFVQGRKIGGCCSAFAIGRNELVTNAHCIKACATRGGTPVVVQNESRGKLRLDVVAQRAHPVYRADSKRADTPDVALLRTSGALPVAVTLASDAELRSIGPGDDVYVLGFPGRVMDPVSPSATFLGGHVGRLMGFDEQPTTPDKTTLILHDAVTRGGNSGSPVFNQYGHVIGVHAAHVDDEEDVSIGGQKTKVVQSSPFRIGMRIDLVRGVGTP